MIIRPADRADYETMAALWFDSWISVGIANETDLTREGVRERFFRDAGNRWDLFAAEEDGAIVGMLALIPSEDRIDQIFVDPYYKGLGVGLELLNFAKARMPGRIVLVTHETNRRARAFYEREGFRLVSTEYDEGHRRTKCHYEWRGDTA
ncbi:MAG: GNAT family N-acetyltransferase [Hyphomonas sp.]|nr:GNAT family N-acetyltransferase [Hyphomonas sp.]